jgi:cyanate permease
VNGVLARLDREAIDNLASGVRPPASTPVAQILTADRRFKTLALWTVYFMGFLTMYFMLSWIPTLFVDAGYTRSQGIDALTGFNLGAIPGILILAFLTTRLPLVPLLSLFFLSAGGVLVYVGLTEPSELGSLMALMFFCGGVLARGVYLFVCTGSSGLSG